MLRHRGHRGLALARYERYGGLLSSVDEHSAATDRSCACRRFRCSSPAILKPPSRTPGKTADDPWRARGDRRVPLHGRPDHRRLRGSPRNELLAPLFTPAWTSGIARRLRRISTTSPPAPFCAASPPRFGVPVMSSLLWRRPSGRSRGAPPLSRRLLGSTWETMRIDRRRVWSDRGRVRWR